MATKLQDESPSMGRPTLPLSRGLYGRELQALVRAVLDTPCTARPKPWHVILLQDAGTLKRIVRLLPDVECEEDAAHAILVCGDTQSGGPLGELVADCYDATTSLLLTARAKRLCPRCATFFPHRDRMEQARRVLGIPPTVIPFSIAVFPRRLVHAPDGILMVANVHRETWR